MTILLVSHTSALDGAERSLAALAQHLQQQQRPCHLLCPEPGPLADLLQAQQIPVTYFKLPRPQRDLPHLLQFIILWPWVVLRLALWLRRQPVSVVYNNTIDSLYAPFSARLAGVPLLWHIREVKPNKPAFRRPFTWLLRYLPQQALFNSQATLQAYAPRPYAHWQIIYNGVPIPPLPAPKPPDQPIVVGWAGQFVPHKRPEQFLQAFALAQQQWPPHLPPLQAVMAGDGPLLPTIQQQIQQAQLQQQLRTVGYLADMTAFYQQIDLFVLTSALEPFGRVVAEAMAAARPVIASHVGGVPELLSADCGFLLPADDVQAFADKIIWLASHAEQRRQLGQNGRERIRQHFSQAQYAQKIMELLTDAHTNR